jgi:hypothetical protein
MVCDSSTEHCPVADLIAADGLRVCLGTLLVARDVYRELDAIRGSVARRLER